MWQDSITCGESWIEFVEVWAGVGVKELFCFMAGSLALSISGGISGDMVVEGIVCDQLMEVVDQRDTSP